MTPAARPVRRPRRPYRAGGFTLIELMVVIGIIVLLAAILLPVVSKVRTSAYDVSTQSQMQRIMQACQQYFHDHSAYPGPIANVNLAGGSNTIAPSTLITNASGGPGITSSENLVLGLLGYLDPPPQGSATGTPPSFNNGGQPTTSPPGPPPHDVLSLNPLRPAKYTYLDYVPGELSNGSVASLESMAGAMPAPADTNIPEFIDRFPNPMPILYMRANVGGTGVPEVNNTDTVNTSGQTLFVQYNYKELATYGCNIQFGNGPKWALLDDSYFGTLATQSLAESTAPYVDWNSTKASSSGTYDGYLTNSNVAGPGGTTNAVNGVFATRGKDGFILIAPGKDRTYGTHDDLIVTP